MSEETLSELLGELCKCFSLRQLTISGFIQAFSFFMLLALKFLMIGCGVSTKSAVRVARGIQSLPLLETIDLSRLAFNNFPLILLMSIGADNNIGDLGLIAILQCSRHSKNLRQLSVKGLLLSDSKVAWDVE